MKHTWGRSTRPLMDNKGRPQFEAIMSNVEQARRMWDMPGLRGYSLVLLRMVELVSIEDANDSERSSSNIELPHEDYLAQEVADRYSTTHHQELGSN